MFLNTCRSKVQGEKMLRDTLEMNIKRIVDFLIYSKNFIIRKSPLKALANSIVEGLKDFLTMKKKLKMAQYRLNYHRHQFQKMEQACQNRIYP